MLTAVNAEDGIEQLNESAKDPGDRFDLVVTDFQMPNHGDGYKVLEHIQGMGKNSKPRHVVMYSSTPGVKEKALELGAEEVYDKTQIAPAKLGRVTN